MIFKKIITIAVLGLSLFLFSACEPKGSAEKAGEKIDKVIENIDQAIEKNSDKAREITGAMEEKADDITETIKK